MERVNDAYPKQVSYKMNTDSQMTKLIVMSLFREEKDEFVCMVTLRKEKLSCHLLMTLATIDHAIAAHKCFRDELRISRMMEYCNKYDYINSLDRMFCHATIYVIFKSRKSLGCHACTAKKNFYFKYLIFYIYLFF